jgi:hypothetical protein
MVWRRPTGKSRLLAARGSGLVSWIIFRRDGPARISVDSADTYSPFWSSS